MCTRTLCTHTVSTPTTWIREWPPQPYLIPYLRSYLSRVETANAVWQSLAAYFVTNNLSWFWETKQTLKQGNQLGAEVILFAAASPPSPQAGAGSRLQASLEIPGREASQSMGRVFWLRPVMKHHIVLIKTSLHDFLTNQFMSKNKSKAVPTRRWILRENSGPFFFHFTKFIMVFL